MRSRKCPNIAAITSIRFYQSMRQFLSLGTNYYSVVVLIWRCRTSVLNRKRKLRELYKHTACCTASLNAGYQPKVEDFHYGEPDEKEVRFLEENDISK